VRFMQVRAQNVRQTFSLPLGFGHFLGIFRFQSGAAARTAKSWLELAGVSSAADSPFIPTR
jgi:hypothetical protein